MDIILNTPPKVHDWGTGELSSSGMPTEVFKFMNEVLNSDCHTIETGLGISTAVFATKETKHTCITPDGPEIKRLKEYLSNINVPDKNITFLCKKSCDVWFDLKDFKSWDLILIDGLHGFPTPFMDWYFLSQGLKINGYLIIDDTHIATGKYLQEFLKKEESWKLINSFYGKTAIFQKVRESDNNKEFTDQPYILQETKTINKYKRLRDIVTSVKARLKKL